MILRIFFTFLTQVYDHLFNVRVGIIGDYGKVLGSSHKQRTFLASFDLWESFFGGIFLVVFEFFCITFIDLIKMLYFFGSYWQKKSENVKKTFTKDEKIILTQ